MKTPELLSRNARSYFEGRLENEKLFYKNDADRHEPWIKILTACEEKWQASQNTPVFFYTSHFGGDFWVYKDCVYLVKGLTADLNNDEVILLILEAFDKERKRFEKLRAKFSGIKKADGRISIPQSIRIFVWQRDGGKCVKCGSRKNLEYDHIIPVSKGGSNTARNIELLCESCNREKSDSIQ